MNNKVLRIITFAPFGRLDISIIYEHLKILPLENLCKDVLKEEIIAVLDETAELNVREEGLKSMETHVNKNFPQEAKRKMRKTESCLGKRCSPRRHWNCGLD